MNIDQLHTAKRAAQFLINSMPVNYDVSLEVKHLTYPRACRPAI